MAYYARDDEDLAPAAIAVVGSAEDPEYPAANLIEANAANPAKLTTTTGNWVLQFAGKVIPVAAALIYQYITAGLEVRLQGNDTNSWGSPAHNQAFTIPAKRRDGPATQRWTINPWMELTTLTDPTGYIFWRLVVVGTNSQAVAVGRLMLVSALHRVDLFHAGGINESDRPDPDLGQIVQPTELGVENIVTIGGPRRGLSFPLIGTDYSAGSGTPQAAADFRALCEATDGREHPFLFIPFETNDAWLVRPDAPSWARTHEQGGYQLWPLSVREVSRGIPWP